MGKPFNGGFPCGTEIYIGYVNPLGSCDQTFVIDMFVVFVRYCPCVAFESIQITTTTKNSSPLFNRLYIFTSIIF